MIPKAGTRLATLILAAALGGAGSWILFSRYLHLRIQMGLTTLDTFCPAEYQVTVFPAFFAFTTALALDAVAHLRRNESLRPLAPRALLILATGLLSCIRLLGFLPLSGHALFLSAALVYTLRVRRDLLVVPLAAIGLAVVTWYKLAVFADAGWLLASLAAGSLIGFMACSRAGALSSLSPPRPPPAPTSTVS